MKNKLGKAAPFLIPLGVVAVVTTSNPSKEVVEPKDFTEIDGHWRVYEKDSTNVYFTLDVYGTEVYINRGNDKHIGDHLCNVDLENQELVSNDFLMALDVGTSHIDFDLENDTLWLDYRLMYGIRVED